VKSKLPPQLTRTNGRVIAPEVCSHATASRGRAMPNVGRQESATGAEGKGRKSGTRFCNASKASSSRRPRGLVMVRYGTTWAAKSPKYPLGRPL